MPTDYSQNLVIGIPATGFLDLGVTRSDRLARPTPGLRPHLRHCGDSHSQIGHKLNLK